MAEREKLVCPDCGVTMNLHAEKIDFARPAGEGGAPDDDLGGRLEEFHTCPACGQTRARHAE